MNNPLRIAFIILLGIITSIIFRQLILTDSQHQLYWVILAICILNIGVNIGIEISRSGTLSASSFKRLFFSFGALIAAVLFFYLILYFFNMVGILFGLFFVITLYLAILAEIHKIPRYLTALFLTSIISQGIVLMTFLIDDREIATFPNLIFLISLSLTTIFPTTIRFAATPD